MNMALPPGHPTSFLLSNHGASKSARIGWRSTAVPPFEIGTQFETITRAASVFAINYLKRTFIDSSFLELYEEFIAKARLLVVARPALAG
jgi:hypothetical protein